MQYSGVSIPFPTLHICLVNTVIRICFFRVGAMAALGKNETHMEAKTAIPISVGLWWHWPDTEQKKKRDNSKEENRDNRSLRIPHQVLVWNLKFMCQDEHWTLDKANKMLLCYRSAGSTAAPETWALWLAERQPGLRLQQTCGTTILFSWQLWRRRKIRRELWWIETMLSAQMASSALDASCYESVLQLVCQVISYREVGST